jgi:hypothetical protein
MNVTIEKNIPIPARSRRGGLAEVVRQMQVGDSIVIPVAQRNGMGPLALRLGIKVATRKEAVGQVRVWRTA